MQFDSINVDGSTCLSAADAASFMNEFYEYNLEPRSGEQAVRMAILYFDLFGALSNRKNKKLKVFVNGKWIHFGDDRYEHFSNDKMKFKNFPTHNDEQRKINYLTRAYGIKNANGKPTAFDIESPNYWSINILW